MFISNNTSFIYLLSPLSSYFPACFPPNRLPPILSLALFDTLLCALVSLHSPLGYWGRDCCLKAMRPDQHVLGNQRQLQWGNGDVQISLLSCKERSGESELDTVHTLKVQIKHPVTTSYPHSCDVTAVPRNAWSVSLLSSQPTMRHVHPESNCLLMFLNEVVPQWPDWAKDCMEHYKGADF